MEPQQGLQGDPGGPEAVGRISILADGGRFTLLADGLSFDRRDNTLLACSAGGTGTEVRAFRAAVGSDQKINFRFSQADAGERALRKDPHGYRCLTRDLGVNTYHLVAVSVRPGLLATLSLDGLWEYLQRHTTTPLQREWLESLRDQLLSQNLLRRLANFGYTQPGLCEADDGHIDQIVKDGLNQGRFRIT